MGKCQQSEIGSVRDGLRRERKLRERFAPWKRTVASTRRKEVIINILRRCHCYVTHGYFMNDDEHDIPPICGGCQNATISVKHEVPSV